MIFILTFKFYFNLKLKLQLC